MSDETTSGDSPESELLQAIEGWDPVDGPARWSDERFDTLARRIFSFQYASDDAYRSFCESRGAVPTTVENYREIPAVATEVFREVEIGPGGDPSRVFRTSGTTGQRRGRHTFESLAAYRASLHPTFVRFCNPERRTYRMLVCAPSPRALPDRSLSFMLGELVDAWGDDASAFFASADAFDFGGMADALDRASRADVPTMLLGTAFGYAEFFDRIDRSWKLSEDARLLETGGFKGRSGELSKLDLYGMFEERLGIPRERCVSEYSMTELSSQAYTKNLVREEPSDPAERAFESSPWARIEVVDPENPAARVAPGERGLIRWYDLANIWSVCAIQTSDVGIPTEEGGVLHRGRAEGSTIRGCSLTAEELAASTTDREGRDDEG